MEAKVVVTVLAVMVMAFFLGKEYQLRNTWTGTYYPDGNSLENYVTSPPLSSKDKCVQWVNIEQNKRNFPENDDYECGNGCHDGEEFGFDLSTTICKTTQR